MAKTETEFWVIVITLGMITGALVCWGPSGIKTGFSGWKASAYGSDWMVVQYAQSGCVITSWVLKNEAIQNESSSDGIFFVNEDDEVVHLSGHYVYIQNPQAHTAADLLRVGYCYER
jgi:hypothetical protein